MVQIFQSSDGILGVLYGFTENDRLGVTAIVDLHELGNSFRNKLSSFFDDDLAVEFFLRIGPLFDRVTIHIKLPCRRRIAILIDIKFYGNDFVWCQESIFDTLL